MAVLIPLPRLALMLIPVALVLLWQWRMGVGVRGYLWALFRMVVQLLAVGYVLVYVFSARNAGPVLAVLAIMSSVAAWIALRTVPRRRRALYLRAWVALVLGGGSVLMLVTQGVLRAAPWFHPQTVIPLAGMVFANTMNGISLAAERLQAELRRGIPWPDAAGTALNTALIPITNALLSVGLVSLPGMMTGQILAGVSPLVAVRYQIMVLLMVFSAIGLGVGLFLGLTRGLWEEAQAHGTVERSAGA